MNELKPLISIIVPVYNVEQYLDKCITSICNQTYVNLELILIDDGSTDSSLEICKNYASRDKRIIVLHKENGGQGSARNMGLDTCTGEYISFLDSDDSLQIDCIEKLYSNLIERNLEISACNYGRYNENEELLSLNESQYADFVIDGIEAQKRIWYVECINLSPWGKLYKRDLWKNVRFKECRFYEDYATMHKIYLQVKRFGYLHEPGVNYLVRIGSDVRTYNEKKLGVLDIADDTVVYCQDKQPDLLNAAITKAVSSYFHIYLNMPENDTKYDAYYKRIRKFIRKYRWNVLKDKRAKKKVKIALLISMISYKLTRKLFVKIKKKDILF